MTVRNRMRINTPLVVAEEIEGETILIHFDSGSYYSANPTGSIVLGLVTAGRSPDQIAAALRDRFQAADVDMSAVVVEFLAQATKEGLLVADDSSEPAPDPALRPFEVGAFEPPRLERFDDLQDLLMLDPIHDVDPVGWPVRAPTEDTAAAGS